MEQFPSSELKPTWSVLSLFLHDLDQPLQTANVSMRHYHIYVHDGYAKKQNLINFWARAIIRRVAIKYATYEIEKRSEKV